MRYAKLVTAAVGLVVLLINPWAVNEFGVDLAENQQGIVNAVISALTAFGVYQVPNS